MRNNTLNLDPKNKFEEIIEKLIFQQIPIYYLESFLKEKIK